MHDLIRQVGDRRARQLLLTGELISGKVALDWGLVNAVTAAERCLDEAIRIAQGLVECAPIGLATTKRLLDETAGPAAEPAGRRGHQRRYPRLRRGPRGDLGVRREAATAVGGWEKMNHRDTETQRSDQEDPLTRGGIGAAIEVHRIALGPGLLESAYQACLCHELDMRGIPFQAQVELPVFYKRVQLDCGYKMDIVVPGRLVIELKAVLEVHPVHHAQLLTYLRLSGIARGLLLNFNVPVLKDGITRMAHIERFSLCLCVSVVQIRFSGRTEDGRIALGRR